ncbi:MAG: hypothetical protein HZA50_12845 [Planctomycetes bacterium]|nr:hypothetical protein [Planctomycetota bacterium]
MRSYIGLAVIVAVASLSGGCADNKPKVIGEEARYVGFTHQDVLKKVGLQYYWDMQVPLGPGERVGRFFAIDENLYCMTNQNNVYAVDAAVGLYRWGNSVANSNQTLFDPIHFDNMGVKNRGGEILVFNGVLFNTLDQMMVYERSKGILVRQWPLGFSANTTGATDGKYFFGGGTDGLYYCLRITDGIQMWKLAMDYLGDLPNQIADLSTRYKDSIDDREKLYLQGRMVLLTLRMSSEVLKRFNDLITAPVLYYNERLFVGNEAGQFLVTKIDGEKGPYQKVWGFASPGGFRAPFIVNASGCYMACSDKRIYAKNYLNGAEITSWKDGPFMTEGLVEKPLQATAHGLYACATDDAFYAINIANGKQMWKNPDARLIVGGGQDKLYVLDRNNNLLIVNETSGAVSASLPMTGLDFFAANTGPMAERIYAATASGKIFCIAPLRASHKTAEMLRNPVK